MANTRWSGEHIGYPTQPDGNNTNGHDLASLYKRSAIDANNGHPMRGESSLDLAKYPNLSNEELSSHQKVPLSFLRSFIDAGNHQLELSSVVQTTDKQISRTKIVDIQSGAMLNMQLEQLFIGAGVIGFPDDIYLSFDDSGTLNPQYEVFIPYMDEKTHVVSHYKVAEITVHLRTGESVPRPEVMMSEVEENQRERQGDWETAKKIFTRERAIVRPSMPDSSDLPMDEVPHITAELEPSGDEDEDEDEDEEIEDAIQIENVIEGPMDEEAVLEKLVKGQLIELSYTSKVDEKAAAYISTILWEKFERIGTRIAAISPELEGVDDDIRALQLLELSYRDLSAKLESFEHGLSLEDEADFWGLTPAVVEKVIPGSSREVAVAQVVTALRPREKRYLRLGLFDKVNDLVGKRLLGILERPLKTDQVQTILNVDSDEFATFLRNEGKRVGFFESKLNALRGIKPEERQDIRSPFANELLYLVRKLSMPGLDGSDDPTTLAIEGPIVPKKEEIRSTFLLNLPKIIAIVDKLLVKYGNLEEISDTTKQTLAENVLSYLLVTSYGEKSEGKRLIDAGATTLANVHMDLFFRPKSKSAEEQTPILSDDLGMNGVLEGSGDVSDEVDTTVIPE